LTRLAHAYLAQQINPGDIVIDATVGNGHDTLFLAKIVGPAGRVIGFDIQPIALAITRQRLAAQGLDRTVTLYQQGHEDMGQRLVEQGVEQVATATFNLGYLPGGDKTLTTQPATTRAAIMAAWRALCPGGLISLLVYVGHPGGSAELRTVETCLQALTANQGSRVSRHTGGGPASPVLLIARRSGSRAGMRR
jgi:predicted methyltransferase